MAQSQINAQNLPTTTLQRTLGMPDGGPKCIPITLDFTAFGTYVLDLSNVQTRGYFDMLQTVWVDNFNNAQILKITVPSTQQVLQVPASTQGYFPILCANPIKLQFDSAGAGVGVAQVTLINCPIPQL
jgi:hypothetical protein